MWAGVRVFGASHYDTAATDESPAHEKAADWPDYARP
jgi:hypothetical protein